MFTMYWSKDYNPNLIKEMGRKCFVPYCKSGYNTCKEVVAMFSCPNDPELLKLWSEAVARQDRPLRSTDCICEKHFREEDILRSWKAYDKKGKEIMSVNYRRIRLRDGSRPCFFPKSKNIYSRKRRKSNTENDDKNGIIPQVKEVYGVYSSNKILDSIDNNSNSLGEKRDGKICETSADENRTVDCIENNESEDSGSENESHYVKIIKTARLFESIWQDVNKIALPSKSWAAFLLKSDGDRKIVFTQMGFSNGVPVPTKQVCFDYRMRVELFLKTTKLNFEEMCIKPPKMYDSDDVSSFIKSVDGLMDWE